MEKVLVLGGSYFIGKRIVKDLLEAGYAVAALNRGTRAAFPGTEEIHADRNDRDGMKAALQGRQFDYAVDVSGLNRLQAENLCAALDGEKLRKFVYISSSAVYAADGLRAPFQEEDTLGPNTFWGDYGVNKAEAEQVYADAFVGTQKVFLRPPYLYGADNYAQRESFIFDHLMDGRPVLVPSSDPMLQFMHTSDLAAAILRLFQLDTGEVSIFNVGSRQAVTASEWVRCCAEAAGKEAEIILYDYQKDGRGVREFFPFPDYDNVLDVEKIHRLCPQELDFIEGLREAFGWFLEHRGEIAFKEAVAQNEREILASLRDRGGL